MWKPRSVIPWRKQPVFASSRSRSSVDRPSSSRAFSEAADDRRGQRVGEQVRPAPLAEQVDDLLPAAGVSAAGPAQGLAQRAGEDVDAVRHAVILGRAAAARAHEADGVRVVDHHQGVVLVGQVADARPGWR